MARIPTPKTPGGLKMPKPRTELDAMPTIRAPIKANRGLDIISITTRMRETPVKKGK